MKRGNPNFKKGGSGNKATQFSVKYQPTGKAKSDGKKKAKEERKLKDLFIELSNSLVTAENDLNKGKLYKLVQTMFPNLESKKVNQRVIMYTALYRILLQGEKGAVQAFNAIRDTMGEKPVDRSSFTNNEGEDLFKNGSITINLGDKDI